MSKFLKFRPTLDVEEAVWMLEHMTSEEADADTIHSLTQNNYLNPIIGEGSICLGFDDEAIEMLLNKLPVKPSATSIIGVYSGPGSVFSDDPNETVFTTCIDASNKAIYFALPPSQHDARQALTGHYSLPDLRSLDPQDQDNHSFLTAEVMNIAESANNHRYLEAPRLPCPVLALESFGDISVVREIKGLPFSHVMGPLGFEPEEQLKKNIEREPPSKNLVLAALLDVVINSEPKRWNQDALATEIEKRFRKIRGLGSKTAGNLFSEANKALRSALKAADPD